MAGGVRFNKPRFRFDVLVLRFNSLEVGSTTAADSDQVSQTSLIRGLSRRGLVVGTDFQTATEGSLIHIKRLSKKRGVV